MIAAIASIILLAIYIDVTLRKRDEAAFGRALRSRRLSRLNSGELSVGPYGVDSTDLDIDAIRR